MKQMSGKDYFTQCAIQSISKHWPVGQWPPMTVSSDVLDETCALMGGLADSMQDGVFGCQRAGADYDLESNTITYHVASDDIAFTGENFKILLRLSELASSVHFLGGSGGGHVTMAAAFSGVFDLGGEEADADE